MCARQPRFKKLSQRVLFLFGIMRGESIAHTPSRSPTGSGTHCIVTGAKSGERWPEKLSRDPFPVGEDLRYKIRFRQKISRR